MTGRAVVVAATLAVAGCVATPAARAPHLIAAAPDYPTTVPGLVTVAPLRHANDVAVIAPAVEHVIWERATLEATEVSATARAPQPPARCADRDDDGVCDERDRCLETPRGERVDQAGCTCELTAVLQFAFDSDELLPADRAVLDGIAARMRALELIAGEASGHTDSIGTEAYNLALSQRRAQSAVDYLARQGVTEARISVRGLGEHVPAADNATAEGRALNRRVVLRRLDCGPSP